MQDALGNWDERSSGFSALDYRIELHHEDGDSELLALSNLAVVAHASFRAAIVAYPGREVVLRLKGEVVARASAPA
jgi:hypothetical protein